MWRIVLVSLMFVGASLLTGCNTLSANNQKAEEEKQRKMSTAKINVQLGLAYLEQRNLQRAKRKLQTALDQAPSIPEPWYSMAYYYEATGEKELAKKYYTHAIDLAPTRGDTHNNYGTFLCRQGLYRDAINQFLIAVKDENYLDPASAYENAGLCAAKIPDKNLAIQYLNHATTQDPNRPISLYKLASLYYDQGKFRVAQTTMTQFSAISPHTSETLALRAKIETKILAENQTKFVSHPSFKHFLADEEPKPIKVADNESLRKKFLKPATVNIIPMQKPKLETKPIVKTEPVVIAKTAVKPAAKPIVNRYTGPQVPVIEAKPVADKINLVSKEKLAKPQIAKPIVASKKPLPKAKILSAESVKVIPLHEAQALVAKQTGKKDVIASKKNSSPNIKLALKKDTNPKHKVNKTKLINTKSKPKALAKAKLETKHAKLVSNKSNKNSKPIAGKSETA